MAAPVAKQKVAPVPASGPKPVAKTVARPVAKANLPIERPKEKKKKKGALISSDKRPKIRKIATAVESIDKIKEFHEEGMEQVEFITIEEPFSYVRVTLNLKTSEYVYNIIEPRLTSYEEDTLKFVLETLNRILVFGEQETDTTEKKYKYLREKTEEIFEDYNINIASKSKDRIFYYIRRDFIGYGNLDVAMRDPAIEDVSIDGTDIPIFLFHRDYGSIKSNAIYETDDELEGFIVGLAQRCGKTISVADPILDATLPDGHRLNCTLGHEITTRGSSLSVRKFRADPFTMPDLIKFGTISPQMGAHLWMAAQYGESMICAGGSASGKTSTMNAISIFIPPASKVISIEDTREVNLPHENWIAGVTRGGAEAQEEGDIDMYDLLRSALRQRPEYVIVGEVRGKETMTMFQAMATGHTTYSTMHAESVQTIVYRLENPPISIPRVLMNALNLVIVHKILNIRDRETRKIKRVRRITELTEIIGIEPTTTEIITNRVFHWKGGGTDTFNYGGHSNLYEKVMELEDKTHDEVLQEVEKRAQVLEWMKENDIRNFTEVSAIIAEYYENPDVVLRWVKEGGYVA